MRLPVYIIAGITLLSGVEARKKKTPAPQVQQSTQISLADFERGRRRKRKKVIPMKRFNYLFGKLQQFQKNNLKSNHKKMKNKSRKFKNVALKNLGTMRQRQVRCTPIEESKKFIRQQNQKLRA